MKNALPQNPLEFNGIIDLMDKIPTDDAAMEYFKLIRWAGHVTCPYCNSEKVYERKHMDKYLAAQSFRYNERDMPEWERLAYAVAKGAEISVTWKQITQQD